MTDKGDEPMKTRKGKKVYPLTPAQRLHFFTQSYCPKKQVLNIGTSLTIGEELDWDTLKKAIYEAYSRCESMRLRFAKDKDGTIYQYVVDKEERDIEHYDFRHWEIEHAKDKLKEWTETPFNGYDIPLNRVVMISMPEGFNGVYLLVDHMTMDAQSLIMFLRDVIEIYCHMKYEGIDYPKPMASYIKQLEKDLAYEADSSAKLRDKEFFEKLIESSEPIFNDIEGKGRLTKERKANKNKTQRAAVYVTDNVDANIATFHLEEEPSHRLMKFCEEHQVSMVCLLMMGLRTFFQKQNDEDDVSIVTTVARRATLSEKKCGGSRIHCFPFRTIVTKEETFLEGIYKIRDGQNQIFRHANYNPVEFYGHRRETFQLKPGQTYEPMSLTYQPMALKNDSLDRLGDIQYKTDWYSNGVAAHALYLTVMHRASDHGLDFNFEHQTGIVTYEKLEYFYYYVCKILFAGIENPNLSVGEIIDLV